MWEVQIDGGFMDEFATFEEAKIYANQLIPEASDNYCSVEIWKDGVRYDFGANPTGPDYVPQPWKPWQPGDEK